jgi:type II secretory pathway pseudopilin PulG
MKRTLPTRRPRPSEQGYMMAAVIFMMALLVFSLALAAPQIKKQIQRDREEETMRRGKQYMRAIQLYYRKFHAYPPNMDALVKTQEIRFLRQKYIDPMTGKDDWKPIQFGQNKAPTAMGFFGVPLGGSSIAGIGPNGGNGLPGATPIGGVPGAPTTTTDPNAAAGQAGQPGQDPNAANGGINGTGTGIGAGPGNGTGGQTFGGAGIIGFSPASPKDSILVYKKKTHYNEWEFTYDPMNDQNGGGMGGAGLNTQPIGGNQPGIGNAPGFGNNNPNQPGINNNPPVNQPAPQPQQ